jgi:biotin carboxyl carrier protein
MKMGVDLETGANASNVPVFIRRSDTAPSDAPGLNSNSHSESVGSAVVDGSAKNAADGAEIDLLHRHLTRMTALTELVAHIESAATATAACRMLVEQLKVFFSADQVVIGLCGERSIECKLTAVSGVLHFHPRSEHSLAAQAVLQECIARGEVTRWPAADVDRSGGLIAHRQFANLADVDSIVGAPIRDVNGRLRGAWMVLGVTGDGATEAVTSFLRAAEAPVASAITLIARAQKGKLANAFNQAAGLVREKRGRALVAALTLLTMILCIPFHYHPSCDCIVEPVTRRYVAAPFAGPLEKSLVEPGDIVAEGQILARMDGREIRMELSGTRAELHRAHKERAGHLATHESGEAEVARYEVDRLQIRTELLEHREHNVEILSPIAGVVVSGDLEDAEGIPLEVGQTLFEIAPLDKMVVEVSIAEDDYAYIQPGMPAIIQLDAFPLRRFHASIKRVHPRAELRDDANVFIAEVVLDNASVGFRPGMRGKARIEADRYPLGWSLFRRPLTAAITWLGW